MTVELAYADTDSGAAPGSRDVLVLLHAFPLSQAMWAEQRTALADVARVITPDLRGFGASPDAGSDGAEPSVDAVADDVAALLDRLGVDRVVLGGLSMGGYVVMSFLRRHAERVRGIALLDTKAAIDAPEARDNRLRMAEAVGDSGTRVLRPMLDTLLGRTTHAERPAVVAQVTRWLDEARPEGVAWAQRAMAARPDSYETLRGADVPALVVVGDEDQPSPPDEARAMVEALPRGQLMVVNGSGHLSSVERPDAVSEGLRGFLLSL